MIVIERGDDITYNNFDFERHDVVQDVDSDGLGGKPNQRWCSSFEGKCPIFWSRLIGLGQSTPILGLDKVKPNTTYTFFCTLHNGMQGTLVVRP